MGYGVSYNFFSQLSSGDASDSICPKGWGMAGSDGDGSWQKLIKGVYGQNENLINKELAIINNEYGIPIRSDQIIAQNSLSLLYSGYYAFDNGERYSRISNGRLWLNFTSSDSNARYFGFYSTNFSPQNSYRKGRGNSLRCVAKGKKRREAVDSVQYLLLFFCYLYFTFFEQLCQLPDYFWSPPSVF